ncbi:unnamed protein product [Arctia plantaginis]|uniref:Alpha-ketoglutarate-dependent dioxygenase alkB homolog 7, mitochondrial n=1 Tax=Arctia plantaginis TaxID=874455 RepID=A0A8S1B7M6_ARCPL|nr:unnamed protein product [Arctia plantaginis]
MRSLTFSFLKNCKNKATSYTLKRMISGGLLQPKVIPKPTADLSLIEIAQTWKEDVEPELRKSVLQDMQVIPEFVSKEEEAAMLAELDPQLKRMRYEFDHWDNAIHGFREKEVVQWSEASEAVLTRIKSVAFIPGTGAGMPMPAVHVLDLASAGYIKPHVDAVKFCGEVIAGLCLVSSAVMRLEHCTNKQLALDALIARRSLYIMRGSARYKFTHAVLGGELSAFRGAPVTRQRRVAVICRSRPDPSAATPGPTPTPTGPDTENETPNKTPTE